jgi:PAS domain S-box-containing protein
MEITHITDHLARGADPGEEQFRLLVSSVTEYAIFLLDPAGRVASWNAGAERIKAYKAHEILGRHYAVFYPAEDRAAGRPDENLATAARDGRYAGAGWRLRKDGSRFWAEVLITVLRDASGTLKGYAKVTRDMTERHAAEEQARQAEAVLEAFSQYSPVLMSLKDREGRYRFANALFLERYAVQPAQVIGRRDADLFPRRQAAAMTAHDAHVMKHGEPYQFEEKVQAGGAERVNLVLKFPVSDGVGMIATDITDRRLAEQALREQRALLAEAQKVAGLGTWEWDPESGRVAWSEQLYRIYGETPGNFRPSFETYLERVHAQDRQNSGAMMARALMDGRGFTMQERIVRPGGEVRYLRSHAEVARNERGKPIKVFGACLDVTEQRHSETALRQAAQDLHALTRKLVQAEEAERRRIAAELHDSVGQSLSVLNINLDIILKADGLPAPLRQRLEDSVALVDSTLQSIESVMAELRPPLLDEYGLAAALGWHARELSRRTGVEVRLEGDAAQAGKELRIEAALSLFRIAQEALNNALKHARATRVRMQLSRDEASVALSVQDDGQGFDAAQAPLGRLGMTTMRERAEAAGGSLKVDSVPGQGTRVTAVVPL